MASPLDLYEPLDIVGNGSFGIIRKVRRKADGLVSVISMAMHRKACQWPRGSHYFGGWQIFARKELNFERMTERDRKQIVAEV